MNEFTKMIAALAGRPPQGVLATVVKVAGSAFRPPGSRLFILPDGSRIGSISSGCLESDVEQRARQIVPSGVPQLVQYDLGAEGDIVWGLGVGCKGVIHILLEPVTASLVEHIRFLHAQLLQGHAVAQATVFGVDRVDHVDGPLACQPGAKWLLSDNLQEHGLAEEPALREILRIQAKPLLAASAKWQVHEFTLPQGKVELLLEAIRPVSLVIFGADDHVVSLVALAKGLGWQVTLTDPRPAYATAARFPQADRVICCQPEELPQRVVLNSKSLAVITSHNFLQDCRVIRLFLSANVRYLGVLSSKKRMAEMLQRLTQEGFTCTPEQLARVYNPVGLDIGAETPEEIALAVVAEIQAVLAHKSGGFLRDRRRQ